MLYALKERMHTKQDARSRPSSPSPVQQTASPQMTPHTPQMTPQASQLQASPTSPTSPTIISISQPGEPEDKRWRLEEIGEIDGTVNVQAFVGRIRSVATHKGQRLVQTHLETVLKELAFNWYRYEHTDGDKLRLHRATKTESWCTALLKRFGPRHTDLFTQLS